MLTPAYGLGQAAAATEAEPPILLKSVGGLAGVSQSDVSRYSRYEAPFWTQQVPLLTTGRVHAEIASFDRAHRDRLRRDAVLPGWTGRCGAVCAETWNRVMAPARGILANME